MKAALLTMVVACATPPAPAPRPPRDARVSLETWVGQWSVARACLVDPAPVLEEGVALAMASGRRCGALLAPLVEAPRGFEPGDSVHRFLMVTVLRIGEAQPPAARAELIQHLDRTLEELVEIDRENRRHPITTNQEP